jgi:hypothetical protein
MPCNNLVSVGQEGIIVANNMGFLYRLSCLGLPSRSSKDPRNIACTVLREVGHLSLGILKDPNIEFLEEQVEDEEPEVDV